MACVELCSRLGATAEEGRERAKRAWEAGLWAKACDQGRVPTPRPTPKLASNLKNTVYIILKAPGVREPVRVSSAGEYFKLLPNFGEGSLSHGFPSLAEARVYCSAFGTALPSER